MSDTVEQFWRNTHGDRVVYRTASKKEHVCGQCRQTIRIGDRYLDTGEAISQWATAKCCMPCAEGLA